MPHYWFSNSFFKVDIPLCHYFKNEIKDLTIGVMDHNKGSDDGVQDFIKSYSLHSFLQVHKIVKPFTNHSNLRNYAEPKPFSIVKLAYVGFFSSIFTMQDHIFNTIGDVLRAHTLCQSLYKKFKYLYKRKKLHIVQAHKKIPSCP